MKCSSRSPSCNQSLLAGFHSTFHRPWRGYSHTDQLLVIFFVRFENILFPISVCSKSCDSVIMCPRKVLQSCFLNRLWKICPVTVLKNVTCRVSGNVSASDFGFISEGCEDTYNTHQPIRDGWQWWVLHVPKEIVTRRIQEISAGINQGRKSDHYLVVWEDYPLKAENGRRLNNWTKSDSNEFFSRISMK